jgi:ssDNA-binding Zn-finger/Zn-ribbon topoisomerase 1
LLKRLLNRSEELVYQRLQQVCDIHSAKVYVKVRVADVLPIEVSGLPDELFAFALQAHYDFVIVRSDEHPLFAIELDGPTHAAPAQRERDSKKDQLSYRFGLPLRRIRTRAIWENPGGLEVIAGEFQRWLNESHADTTRSGSNGRQFPSPRCPVCGSNMIRKLGRRGAFMSCVRFPTCRGSCDLPSIKKDEAPQIQVRQTRPSVLKEAREVPVFERPVEEVLRSITTPAPTPRETAPKSTTQNRIEVENEQTFQKASSAAREVWSVIPDWIQGILWGLGAAACLLLLARGLWLLYRG